MVVANGAGGGAEAGDGLQGAGAPDRVLAHDRPLGVVERAGLVQDLVGHADLAEVVQVRGDAQVLQLVAGDADAAGDLLAERHDRAAVLARVAVAQVQQRGERLDAGAQRGRKPALGLGGAQRLAGQGREVVTLALDPAGSGEEAGHVAEWFRFLEHANRPLDIRTTFLRERCTKMSSFGA